MAAEWHYSQNGQQHGPVSASDLKAMAKSGDLTPTDMVWKEGMADWKPARCLKGLFPSASGSAPPPLPPPPFPKSTLAPVIMNANRVTGELHLEGNGGTQAILKQHIDVLLDKEKIGTGSLHEGFHLQFESTVGHHSIELEEGISGLGSVSSIFNRLSKMGLSKAFPVEFDKPGHYMIIFLPPTGIKAKLGLEKLPANIEIEYTSQALDVAIVSQERKSALVGLWQDVTDSGRSFMFTHDDAMIRDDGFATKFRWLAKDKIDLYADGCENTVRYQILSLGKHELILTTGQVSCHFQKGATITEIEIKKRELEARKQQAEAAQNFKNAAVGVAAVLAAGGFAVMCGGVGVGAAAAGVGVGIGAASAPKHCTCMFPVGGPVCANCGLIR